MRRVWLDTLKGAAMVFVLFNHALLWPMRGGDRPAAFAYGLAFGTVAAFAAVTGFLNGLRPPGETRAQTAKRAVQLLVPWAVWAVPYALAPLVWTEVGGGRLPLSFEPWPWALSILLGGGPLWFLPVLFVAGSLCTLLDRRTQTWWPAILALVTYALIAVPAALSNVSPLAVAAGTFWPVAPLYVAAYWFGVRMGRDGLPPIRPAVLVAVIFGSMIAGGMITWLRAMEPQMRWLGWLPYAVGLVGGCAALVLAGVEGPPEHESVFLRWLVRAGKASLGLYVIHPVLLAPLSIFAAGRGGVLASLTITLLAAAVGVELVERSRNVPWLRYIV